MLAVHLEAFKYVVRALGLFFVGEMHVFWSLGFPLVAMGSSAALSIAKGASILCYFCCPQCSRLMEWFGQESTWRNLILLLVL